MEHRVLYNTDLSLIQSHNNCSSAVNIDVLVLFFNGPSKITNIDPVLILHHFLKSRRINYCSSRFGRQELIGQNDEASSLNFHSQSLLEQKLVQICLFVRFTIVESLLLLDSYNHFLEILEVCRKTVSASIGLLLILFNL